MSDFFQKTIAAIASGALGAVLIAGCSSGSNNNNNNGDDGGAMVESGAGCSAGQMICNGACSDTKKDHDNCGACGMACKMGEVCSQGTCATSCGGGTTQCGNICTTTKNDPDNCGMCGTKCKMGEFCSQGTCASTCGGGTTQCGNICADTKLDPMNCGMCGKQCAQGEVCTSGTCASTCVMGQTKCGGGDGGAPYCANLQSDNSNCGMCGNACAALEVCSMGTCSSSCIQGQTKCGGGDGGAPYCANLQSDNSNCGMCGKTCGALEVCSMGACSSNCIQGQTKCTVNNQNYCANLQTDNANCGNCGTTCVNNTTCINGACKPMQLALMVCGADVGYQSDVIQGLKTFKDFSTVDSVDCSATTPTLSTLKQYDAVFTYSNNTYADPVTLGDNLADYWDAGGHVVVAVFANGSSPWFLQGKFGTANNGYILITSGNHTSTNETGLSIIDSQSPLVANVSSLQATSAYHSTGSIINGGFSVANWSPSGAPLVVRGTKNGRKLVELNFFPPSTATTGRSDFWIGDGFTIIRNALLYR